MLNSVLEFFTQFATKFEAILFTIGIASGVFFVVTLLFTPYLLGLIPKDYFVNNPTHNPKPNSIFAYIKIGLKNLIGLILLLLGMVMLITPGQGVISILLGLFLMQFPGKHRLELRLIHHNPTFKTLNWLRAKAGKPPLQR